ncbi:Interleukin-13 receptor subunit alpha-2 [Liparis tanakae]|uniref:Interleukin-13 receptor subunit alpha-2 n=1 Tax=Liparis tanakae TaxID=230148 RepID=A0A4Z2ECV6_9TELE|nr:Interleukin-13 receptor subunit alpha-2 [Liparis tanakae]
MEGDSRPTRPATLMLLLLVMTTSPRNTRCGGHAGDPPEDLVISDLGHLGHLQIRWSPPASFLNMTECSRQYQLEYFDTYKNSWTVSAEFLNSSNILPEMINIKREVMC